MDGADWIKNEREEHVPKHGYTEDHDDEWNSHGELAQAAGYLIGEVVAFPHHWDDTFCASYPAAWDPSHKEKFDEKSDIEKLVVAGALIAAEIDRLVRLVNEGTK